MLSVSVFVRIFADSVSCLPPISAIMNKFASAAIHNIVDCCRNGWRRKIGGPSRIEHLYKFKLLWHNKDTYKLKLRNVFVGTKISHIRTCVCWILFHFQRATDIRSLIVGVDSLRNRFSSVRKANISTSACHSTIHILLPNIIIIEYSKWICVEFIILSILWATCQHVSMLCAYISTVSTAAESNETLANSLVRTDNHSQAIAQAFFIEKREKKSNEKNLTILRRCAEVWLRIVIVVLHISIGLSLSSE